MLEGPAARVFGTSSLVGAINVVTRDGRGKMDEVRVEGGSYGYLSTAGRISLPSAFSHLTSSFSANYTRSDGYSRSKVGHLNSDYQGGKVFYQGGYNGQI